jgi:hypothetical protein
MVARFRKRDLRWLTKPVNSARDPWERIGSYIGSNPDHSFPFRILPGITPFLAQYDLDGSWREFALYIEAPNGERIEQPEINRWCQNRFEQLKKIEVHATSPQ